VTVHFGNDAWIEPQLRYLRRFAPEETQIWASLDGIAPGRGFDHEFSFSTSHWKKLNEIARRVSDVADADDHLLFLDGDAFPVAPLAPVLALGDPLVAVRAAENADEKQPHPCFALTTVGCWNEIDGDWAFGYVSHHGHVDVGGALLTNLGERGVPWRALTRRNTVDLDPLWFAVYGDAELGSVVYHHWAGFRRRVARAHRVPAPAVVPAGVPVLGRLERSLRWRWRNTKAFDRSYERRGADVERRVRHWIATDDNIADRFVGVSPVGAA
jgi:hypothetical protein